MKKLSVILLISLFSGCYEEDKEHVKLTRKNPLDNYSVEARKVSAASDEQKKCSTDAECTLVPIGQDDCFGCFDENGSGQMAVNVAYAETFMKDKQEKCMKAFESKKNNNQPPKMSNHESCKFNWAKCERGLCNEVTLPQEELKKNIESIKKAMEAQGNPQR